MEISKDEISLIINTIDIYLPNKIKFSILEFLKVNIKYVILSILVLIILIIIIYKKRNSK